MRHPCTGWALSGSRLCGLHPEKGTISGPRGLARSATLSPGSMRLGASVGESIGTITQVQRAMTGNAAESDAGSALCTSLLLPH